MVVPIADETVWGVDMIVAGGCSGCDNFDLESGDCWVGAENCPNWGNQ